MSKTLLIHAGTHKTASTYIQSRMQDNKDNLENNGVKLLDIKRKIGAEKILPAIVYSRDIEKLQSFLSQDSPQHQALLYSAEQCTQLLLHKKRLKWFMDALESTDFRLRIAIFVRDQPDYINSMYVQKAKKFLHSVDITSYVWYCLRQQRYWFNYNYMFSGMIDNPGLDVDFLPYGRQFGDPFERLMALPGWLQGFQGEWLPSVVCDLNDQPGIKGVHLALNVSRQLESLGVDLSTLRNRARYIRKYLSPLGWGSDRYFGLKNDQIELIRDFYQLSNKRFSKKVWPGFSWRSVFSDQKKQHYNVLDEESLSIAERDEITLLARKVIDDLKEANPDAFPSNISF